MVDLGSNKKRGLVGKTESPLNFKIKLIVFFMICDLALLFGILYGIHLHNSTGSLKENYDSIYSLYEKYSDKFSSDPIILNISSQCLLEDNKVFCVFREIPMIYVDRDGLPSFRIPEDYFIMGGVCRDVTLLRHSALSNLDINCNFNFNTPNHVYLICYDGGKVYELNNGYYRQW